jgi:hypothetical protein
MVNEAIECHIESTHTAPRSLTVWQSHCEQADMVNFTELTHLVINTLIYCCLCSHHEQCKQLQEAL